MGPARQFLDYLLDIHDAIQKAHTFLAGMTFEQFEADDKTAFAVVRALEVIGEAARKIPDPVRAQYPDLPWREMMGMRNILIHDYFGVNLRVVWNTVHNDLPTLKKQIEDLIAEIT